MKDTPVQLGRLKKAIENNDAELVAKQAHTIMSVSGNIGAHALRDTALEIEITGKDQILNKARLVMKRLETEFEKLRIVLPRQDA